MADTARTRATLLSTYYLDNVTGQISAQDLRDGVVTWMPEEFKNPMDYWAEPRVENLDDGDSDDGYYRGWVEYSQHIETATSFGAIMFRGPSGTWSLANVATSQKAWTLGMALSEYADGESQGMILRRGLIYNSNWSAASYLFSNNLGCLCYLGSTGSAGEVATVVSVSQETTLSRVIGYVIENSKLDLSDGTSAHCGTMYFDPMWGVV